MAIIENFATVRYTSGGVTETTVSNTAQVSLESSVTLTKVPLEGTYEAGSLLTYILTVQNTSGTTVTGTVIEDNLGTFSFGTQALTPLEYGENAILLINGQDATASLGIDASSPSALRFTLPPLPAGTTANVIYNARVNDFAPPELGGTITNAATLTSDEECASAEAEASVAATVGASVQVFKQMSPNPVVCGGTLTYTIQVSNYGNANAEDVQLIDNLDPAPDNLTVTRNGVPLVATEYTYENGLLTITAGSATGDTVPAATFVRDPVTGVVTVTPGTVEYVITGTL